MQVKDGNRARRRHAAVSRLAIDNQGISNYS